MKYTPAVLIGIMNSKKIKPGFDNFWWTDKSFFKYSHLLCSAYHNRHIDDYRKHYGIPKDVKIFGDSGGFQLFSSKGNIDINAKDTFTWQMKNCDIAMTLDYPTVNPTIDKGSGKGLNIVECTDEEFKERLNFTIENNKIYTQMLKDNPDSKIKVYNILQSSQIDFDRTRRWFDGVKEFPFYGYAIGSKPPSNIYLHAKNIAFLLDRNITKNVHILGASGFYSMILFAYASNFIKNLTFDTTSYGIGARLMQFIMPSTFSKIKLDLNHDPVSSIPCSCEVCKHLELEEYTNRDSMAGNLMTLHNLKQYIEFTKLLDSIKPNRKLLLKISGNHKVLRKSFDFIDYSREHGFEKAYEKYKIISVFDF